MVICDHDSVHHARAVRTFLAEDSRLDPTVRICAVLMNRLADTASDWSGRRRRPRLLPRPLTDRQLTTAAPWTSPGY
ncbi:hypothetical protein [Actinomadura sp. 21ATH]|uniref:hypothetical protein n=1 Tax=Actinomadura sp. 21ATH TaxID=1735444 RepID=UPI0035BF32AE